MRIGDAELAGEPVDPISRCVYERKQSLRPYLESWESNLAIIMPSYSFNCL